MKRFMNFAKGATIATLLLLTACSKKSGAGTEEPSNVKSDGNYVIMTYNIRYDAPDPGNRSWIVRRPLVKERILTNNCDILGVQEALGNQLSNLLTDLPGYSMIGIGRDGNSTSEYCAIFYRTAQFSLLSSGTFWLSPGAPTTVTGPSWDAALRRICTWAQFQDKGTSQKFWVFNSHFDQDGPTARQNSAALILSQMASKMDGQEGIFMGDLNCNQNSVPFSILNESPLLEETWNIAASKSPGLRVTGNSWLVNPAGDNQIDHIFVTSQWSVASLLIDWGHKEPGDIVPSDHWPVIVNMKLP